MTRRNAPPAAIVLLEGVMREGTMKVRLKSGAPEYAAKYLDRRLFTIEELRDFMCELSPEAPTETLERRPEESSDVYVAVAARRATVERQIEDAILTGDLQVFPGISEQAILGKVVSNLTQDEFETLRRIVEYRSTTPRILIEEAVRWAPNLPFTVDAPPEHSSSNVPDELHGFVTAVVEAWTAAKAGKLQKEIAGLLETKLQINKRSADAVAAIIRPLASASKDKRAARRP